MEANILETYMFFEKIKSKYSKKLHIYLYTLYPTYTFYKFDDTLIVSMYPLTEERRPTPTFKIDMNSEYAEFFKCDILRCKKELKEISAQQFSQIIAALKKEIIVVHSQ